MQDFEIEKTQYTIILNQAISLTESYILKLPELSIYKIILEQLLYVKNIIVDQNRKPTEEEVDPVTFGAIAVKNFDEDNGPYKTLLINLYGDFERFSEE